MADRPLLDVQKLNIRFNTPTGIVHVMREVSFTLGREKLAIVGESGSGKSQTARAILGLTTGQITAQKLEFAGENLLGLSAGDLIQVETEPEALDAALQWARAGDLILMLTHEDRPTVLRRLTELCV